MKYIAAIGALAIALVTQANARDIEVGDRFRLDPDVRLLTQACATLPELRSGNMQKCGTVATGPVLQVYRKDGDAICIKEPSHKWGVAAEEEDKRTCAWAVIAPNAFWMPKPQPAKPAPAPAPAPTEAAETDREKILHRGLLSFKRPVRACWSEGCEMFPAEGREWIVLDFKDAPEGRAWCISSGFITSPTPKCAWTAPLPAVNYNIRVLEKGCHLRNSC